MFSFHISSIAQLSEGREIGKVNLKGAILNPACTIAMKNNEQIIDLNREPARKLLYKKIETNTIASIKFINCSFNSLNNNKSESFEITVGFYNDADNYSHKNSLPEIVESKTKSIINYNVNIFTNDGVRGGDSDISSISFKLNYF